MLKTAQLRTQDPVERKLIDWMEQTIGGAVTAMTRQNRWRPAWFVDLTTAAGVERLYVRGERDDPPLYPMMWARDPGASFLRRPPEMLGLIEDAGFTARAWDDVTAEMAGSGGPVPAHSIQRIVMGAALEDIIRAGNRNREQHRIVMIQAVFDRLEAPRC